MIKLALLRLSQNIGDEAYWRLTTLAEPEKLARVRKLRMKSDRERSLCANALVKHILHTEFHIPAQRLLFAYSNLGKPYLKQYPQFHFSVSHSHEWCACAVSDKPVGIDIQYHEKQNFYLEIAEQFYSREEWAYLRALPPEERQQTFYDLWTEKESALKAVGWGLQGIKKVGTILQKCKILHFSNIPGYSLCACFLPQK